MRSVTSYVNATNRRSGRRLAGLLGAGLAHVHLARPTRPTAWLVGRDVVHPDSHVAMYYTPTMSENPITITIKGKVGYEDEITVAQAARIIAFLNADEADASLGPDLGASLDDTSGADTAKKTGTAVGSAREALDLSGARRTLRRSSPSGRTSCRTAERPSRSRTSRRSFGVPERQRPATSAGTSPPP